MSNIQCPFSNVQHSMSNVQCPMSNVQCPISNIQYLMSNFQCPIFKSPMSNVKSKKVNVKCQMSNVKYQKSNVKCWMPKVNNLKILSELTSGAPPFIFLLELLLFWVGMLNLSVQNSKRFKAASTWPLDHHFKYLFIALELAKFLSSLVNFLQISRTFWLWVKLNDMHLIKVMMDLKWKRLFTCNRSL